MAERETQLIWSCVAEKWVVSIIYRQSSACVNSPPWYYEIMIREWNNETKTTGNIVGTYVQYSKKRASKQHHDICLCLALGKDYEKFLQER